MKRRITADNYGGRGSLHQGTRLALMAAVLLKLIAVFAQAGSETPMSGLGEPQFKSGYTVTYSWPVAPLGDELQWYDHGTPTDYEQLMLELINRARAAPGVEATRLGIDLNEGLDPGTIADTPKPPLSLHPLLITAARDHSAWMLENSIFSHTGDSGSTPGERMFAAGYIFAGSWSWGENIAWGGSTGSIELEAQTRGRHDSLFISPGHRTNICNEQFDELGLGLVEGVFTSAGWDYNALMVTQKYALSGATPGPRIVGVVYSDTNQNAFYDIGEGLEGVTVSVEGGDWQTATSASGGYALPYVGSEGFMTIRFEGVPLPQPLKLQVAKTGENIKVDVETLVLDKLKMTEQGITIDGSAAVIKMDGPQHVLVELQYSTDLKEWVTVSTHAGVSEPLAVEHEFQTTSPIHFYRIILAE